MWWLRRAREMSLRELPHRAREQVRRRVDRRAQPVHPSPGSPLRWPVGVDVTPADRRRAEASWRALGPDRAAWHVDPITGEPWPLEPWPSLRRLGRDPRATLMRHRLQEQQLGALAGDRAALDDVLSWIDENPPPVGVGWASGLEVACRVVSLMRVAAALEPDAEALAVLRGALRAHGRYLLRHPSLHSSANNHRLAEGAALMLLGTTDLPEAARHARIGARAVAEVLPTLVLADGGGAERSVRYQAFAMEWALVARACAPLGDDLDDRLAAGALHLGALLDPGGHAPAIGDDDGGVVLAQPDDAAYVRSVAGAVGAVLGRPEVVPPGWAPDPRSRWLGGQPVEARATPGGRSFPLGGLTVLRSRRLHVTVDHGPLGWPALAAHGHADALAVWVSVDGEPLLVGCGTYGYLGTGGWRSWLRGTGAHHTVLVGGLDSSRPDDDPFLWRSRARCELESVRVGPDGGEVRAWHDGYQRRLGVIHRRAVRVDGGRLEVTDVLEGQGTHRVALPFHLPPGAVVERDGDAWSLDGRARLRTGLRGDVIARDPSEGPGPGVISPRPGELVSAPALWFSEAVQLPWTHTWVLEAR